MSYFEDPRVIKFVSWISPWNMKSFETFYEFKDFVTRFFFFWIFFIWLPQVALLPTVNETHFLASFSLVILNLVLPSNFVWGVKGLR